MFFFFPEWRGWLTRGGPGKHEEEEEDIIFRLLPRVKRYLPKALIYAETK